jgi:hypothetical protein
MVSIVGRAVLLGRDASLRDASPKDGENGEPKLG